MDQLSIAPQSETTDSETFHDSYRCGSTMMLIRRFESTVRSIMLNWSAAGELRHVIHRVDRHLMPLLTRLDTELTAFLSSFSANYVASHRVFCEIEIGLLALIVVLAFSYHITIARCFRLVMSLLRRIEPAAVAASEDLSDYLLSSTARKRGEMLTDERIPPSRFRSPI
jgi:hypothetical protein